MVTNPIYNIYSYPQGNGNRRDDRKAAGLRDMETENRSFENFGLSKEIMEALKILGYYEPTRIQEAVIPHGLAGRSITAKSQTGSGKTAAFAIPLCERVLWEENLPQALVLEPTRELTVQVKQEIFQIGRNRRLKVPDLFGGFPIDKQIQTLKQKSHIVAGTPGRVMDHIRRQSLKLDKIRYLVIDEADLMLDMGFAEDVTSIIRLLPENPVIMLFSATLNGKVKNLVSEFMQNAVEIFIEENQDKASIEQKLYRVLPEDKYDVLLSLLVKENPDNCMIFCGTRDMADILGYKLKRDGLACRVLHGEIDQKTRLNVINGFKEGRFCILIATDVAARGVDIDKLTHVFQYDFPTGREIYVHRIGRTGRNGQTGTAVSLVTSADERMVGLTEESIGYSLPFFPLPECSKEETDLFYKKQKEKTQRKAPKGAGFQASITRLSIGGGRKSKIRTVDIVGTICSIDGVKAEDIGVIDVRESLTYVEILNGKGKNVLEALQNKTMKGKLRKVRVTKRW